jgi:HAD superfamily hydrolase (TIGR01549 family)
MPSQMLTTYLFDLDGTLIDSDFYAKQYPEMIEKIKARVGEQRMNSTISRLKKVDGRYDTGELCKELGILDLYYKELAIPELRPEAKKVLSELKGLTIGIITSSMHATVTKYLNAWKVKVTYVFTPEDAGYPKSRPEFWQKLIQRHNIISQSAIVIGDSIVDDIMVPKRLGFRTLHVTSAKDLLKILH